MCDLARQTARAHGVEIEAIATPVERLDVPPGAFDIVYGANLLHHVQDIDGTLAAVERALKPGGRCFFWDPLAYNPAINVYRRMARACAPPTSTRSPSRSCPSSGAGSSRSGTGSSGWPRLALFLKYYFVDRLDPNQVRYWKRILEEDPARIGWWFSPLQRLDAVLLRLPLVRRLAWNIAVWGRKAAYRGGRAVRLPRRPRVQRGGRPPAAPSAPARVPRRPARRRRDLLRERRQRGRLGGLARAESRRDPRITVIDLSRNFGHSIAITAGLDHARGDAVVVMDCDLQDPPELVPQMVALYRQGFDVVHARRRTRRGESPFKRLTARLFYWTMRLAADRSPEPHVGEFRLMSRAGGGRAAGPPRAPSPRARPRGLGRVPPDRHRLRAAGARRGHDQVPAGEDGEARPGTA